MTQIWTETYTSVLDSFIQGPNMLGHVFFMLVEKYLKAWTAQSIHEELNVSGYLYILIIVKMFFVKYNNFLSSLRL